MCAWLKDHVIPILLFYWGAIPFWATGVDAPHIVHGVVIRCYSLLFVQHTTEMRQRVYACFQNLNWHILAHGTPPQQTSESGTGKWGNTSSVQHQQGCNEILGFGSVALMNMMG